ncbi:MAG TPA: glycosyltransferase family 39 protein [Candidatus Paceibacterota bacterium]
MFNFFKKQKIILLCLFLLFLALRLPGLHLPYHQDERKAVVGYSSWSSGTPHPPLTRAIFALDASIFGRDNFRAMPMVFGVANLVLIFYFMRKRFGEKAAVWSTVFFSVSFYSVLGSLMTEMDGQVLPFFFLLSLISYFNWKDAEVTKKRIIWGLVFLLAITLGFLTKLNYIIAVGAFIIDFLIDKKTGPVNRKLMFKYLGAALGLIVLLGVILLNAKFFFKSYDLTMTINHVKDFIKLSGRAYLQIAIQVAKAVMYASPLLLVPLFWLSRSDWKRFRVLWIFLLLGGVFYLVVFDFSRSALDKYLAYIIVPLSIISGTLMSGIFGEKDSRSLTRLGELVFFGLVVAFIISVLQFIPHFAPALYPKEEWIGRIIKLRWNFVFPFTGGSGPLGFYVSWLFIATTWAVSILLVIVSLFRRGLMRLVACVILLVGLAYSVVFSEEYLFGKINGNPNALLKNAVNFIEREDRIHKVISYNDIGAYELTNIGKYERRLYAAPKFERAYTEILKNFNGHYLVIDIPHLSPSSPYFEHFLTCDVIYEDYSVKISAKIYDCQNKNN